MSKLISLFSRPLVIGVIGDVNQAKSMLLYHTLEELNKEHKFNLYTYGLRINAFDATQVYSVAEIETIQNSIIIVDELSSLFDLDNRKQKKMIENTLRLINHNNNILVLCGVPENFKKFISGKLDVLIYKKTTIADCINGCGVKNTLMAYKGNERGSEVLNLPKEEALLYDGTHYHKIHVPYYQKYDSKAENVNILQQRQSTTHKKLEEKGFIKIVQ